MKYALCMGNNYPGTNMELKGCVNDAVDMKEALDSYGFDTHMLLDRNGTRQNMLTEIQGMISVAEAGDLVFLHNSSHGTWVPDKDKDETDGRDECLVPYDVRTNGVITDDELHTIFKAAAKGVVVVFFSDSCHSGSLNRFMPALDEEAAKIRYLAPEEWHSGMIKDIPPVEDFMLMQETAPRGKSRLSSLLFSGCKDREYSYDASFDSRPNGAFTYVALRVLRQLSNKYPNPTYRDWYREIKRILPSQDYPQTPQLTGPTEWKGLKILQDQPK